MAFGPCFCPALNFDLAGAFEVLLVAPAPPEATFDAAMAAFSDTSCCRKLPLTGIDPFDVFSFLRLAIVLFLKSALQQ